MVISLLVMLAVTVLATFWAGKLAKHRGRHVGGWTLATATLPPLVLLLWMLPIHRSVKKV